MTKSKLSRIFLVDDHPLLRSAMAQLLEANGFSISGQAESCAEALRHPNLLQSDLAVVDISLGEENGMELIRSLRINSLPILVYSMHEGSNIIRRALEAGAAGFVTKREAAQSLIAAIRTVLAGGRFLSPRAESALMEATPLDVLNGQQRKIYLLLGKGATNEDIARQLNISIRTLESYFVRIQDKLGISGVKKLRCKAIQEFSSVPPSPGI